MSDYITFLFDWSLSQAEFRDSIRGMIHQAQKKGKVLALPISIMPGQTFIDLLTMLLARIDCESCNVPCCRENPADKLTPILMLEYQQLSEKYGQGKFIKKDGKAYLPMPCPFLRKRPQDGHGLLCSIYQDRPIACILYPLQFDAAANAAVDGVAPVMALDSRCPSARRLARDVYMTAWQIRGKFRMLGDKEFWKGFA